MTAEEDCMGRMCRACMCKGDNFHSLSERTDDALRIAEVFATTVPQLTVRSGESRDQLPQLICSVCLNKLNIAFQFQRMCISADKRMRALLADATKVRAPLHTEHPERHTAAPGTLTDAVDSTNINSTEGSTEEDSARKTAVDSAAEKNTVELALNGPCEEAAAKVEEGEREHAAENASRRKYACAHCDKDFDRPYRLRRHIAVHATECVHSCEVGKHRFSSKKSLECHKQLHKADEVAAAAQDAHKCEECARHFAEQDTLAAHLRTLCSVGGARVKCEFCDKKFKQQGALPKHRAQLHAAVPNHNCRHKAFQATADPSDHRDQHESAKLFMCSHCDKGFQQNGSLKEHLRTHTGESPFLCSQCGKSFKSSSNMRQHLLRHSGEKRYQCPECPSKFACQSDKIKHMSTHRATKPHVCDICGSSFSRSYTLAKHKHIHTGERPHKCEDCKMTFIFLDHLKRHMRKHTGEKPHKCKFCERAYAESGDLNKHLRLHVGEKTYMCDECPEAFKYQAELREHQIKHYKAHKTATPS